MGRKRKFPPSIHLHRRSGRAFVRWEGRDHYLGVHGSDAAKAAYARLVAELASGRSPGSATPGGSVNAVVAAWLEAEGPRLDRRQFARYRQSLAPLLRLYGPTPAADFDADRLEAVQLAAASGSWLTDADRAAGFTDWSRRVVNQRMGMVRTVWRWAERRKLVPAGAWGNLRTLPGLRADDRRVRHLPRRRPASWDEVRAVARHAVPPVRAVLLLCWWTGMRPAEAYTLTPAALDRSNSLWVYRPGKHKTAHLGTVRAVAIGPKGKAVIRPWLTAAALSAPDATLFRPAGRFRGVRPDAYRNGSFCRAVKRAADLAGLPGVTAYTIRHAFRQRVTRTHGLDGARAAMGHTSVAMTAEYAREVDMRTAGKVAEDCG